ncbi:MAG: stage II sporulation protein R [Firmicutes bacterium]|nr:stage II sporulation protein R [Bacillota bacterium]
MNKEIKLVVAGLVLLGAIYLPVNLRHTAPETVFPPDNLIRLHVVANSDSASDQALKRKVRDEIVRNVAPEFLGAENIESARTIARANLGRIKEIASREIEAEGKDYPVKVELDSFAFPTKHYGPFVLPAGDYEAVRVVIGSGGGANWWCVLFPPLCFVDMSKGVAVSQPETGKPASTLPSQNITAAEEQQPVAVVPQMTGGSTGGDGADTPEETFTRVEFRFRILDFLHRFIS